MPTPTHNTGVKGIKSWLKILQMTHGYDKDKKIDDIIVKAKEIAEQFIGESYLFAECFAFYAFAHESDSWREFLNRAKSEDFVGIKDSLVIVKQLLEFDETHALDSIEEYTAALMKHFNDPGVDLTSLKQTYMQYITEPVRWERDEDVALCAAINDAILKVNIVIHGEYPFINEEKEMTAVAPIPKVNRYRFTVEAEDYRPLEWPYKYPYWCTSYSDEGNTLVAYAESEEELMHFWPDAGNVEITDKDTQVTFSSRFQRPEWYTGPAQMIKHAERPLEVAEHLALNSSKHYEMKDGLSAFHIQAMAMAPRMGLLVRSDGAYKLSSVNANTCYLIWIGPDDYQPPVTQ